MQRYGAVLLAAGLGSRFAAGDKLLHPLDGRPVLEWALERLAQVRLAQRIVVVGPDPNGRRALAERYAVHVVINPQPQAGMGHSLALGIQALDPSLDAVFVCLGDMPGLDLSIFDALVGAFERGTDETIVIPCHGGQRGHPVLFGRAHFAALAQLRGDQGARSVVARADHVIELKVDAAGVLRDIDTVADLGST
jgi:molybdenum cofactor cytidylyltransferase